MTRLFMACLSTETNTFSPLPTTREDYEAYFLSNGGATARPPNYMTESLHLWRREAEALGWDIVEGLTAIAEPAGKTTAETYESFKEAILSDLVAAAPDVILFSLHGAMVAEGCDDCEGDLLAAARALRPDAIMGVQLDQHCHLTQALVDAADLIITLKEYPHDDATPRAAELFALTKRLVRGEIAPVMAIFDCRMTGLYLTKTDAMADFVARMQAEEGRNGILSVSLAHGFPWGDVAEAGTRMMVIADGDAALAAAKAETLGLEFFAAREAVTQRYFGLSDALDQAAGSARPVVLADMSDNSGAGAPGDSTYVLEEILSRGLKNVASGLYFDPPAVEYCRAVGVGAQVDLQVGGKLEPASGRPVPVVGRVMAIRDACGQLFGLGREPMGTAVWLRLPGDVDLVINDLRVQVYHPEAFTQLGIDLPSKRLITVKSLFHFYSPFAALGADVIFCATPGRVNPDMRRITYAKRDGRYWPGLANPFSE